MPSRCRVSRRSASSDGRRQERRGAREVGMSGLGIAAALGIFAIGTALSTQRTAYQLSTVGPQANLQEGARVMSSERAFKAILPEEIEWKPFPAFPPSVRLAVVVGRPTEKELYAIRVKVPGDVKMMPHR